MSGKYPKKKDTWRKQMKRGKGAGTQLESIITLKNTCRKLYTQEKSHGKMLEVIQMVEKQHNLYTIFFLL